MYIDSPRVGSWSRMSPIFAVTLQRLLLVWCDICNSVKSTSGHRDVLYIVLTHKVSLICARKIKPIGFRRICVKTVITSNKTAAI